jgi:methionine aminopeptidase type I
MMTSALDAVAEAVIKRNGATSNFKGYHGFPATICVSVNDEIVHGIPGDRVINDGDVVSVDCGAIVEGWHGDAAFSVGVGNVDLEDQKLMDVCEESMWRGIAAGTNGAKLSDIGHAIEEYTKSQGSYGILQEYGGHGIGTEMHQEPHVLNFGKPGNGPVIVPGFVLAIPMFRPILVLSADANGNSVNTRGFNIRNPCSLTRGRPWSSHTTRIISTMRFHQVGLPTTEYSPELPIQTRGYLDARCSKRASVSCMCHTGAPNHVGSGHSWSSRLLAFSSPSMTSGMTAKSHDGMRRQSAAQA